MFRQYSYGKSRPSTKKVSRFDQRPKVWEKPPDATGVSRPLGGVLVTGGGQDGRRRILRVGLLVRLGELRVPPQPTTTATACRSIGCSRSAWPHLYGASPVWRRHRACLRFVRPAVWNQGHSTAPRLCRIGHFSITAAAMLNRSRGPAKARRLTARRSPPGTGQRTSHPKPRKG